MSAGLFLYAKQRNLHYFETSNGAALRATSTVCTEYKGLSVLLGTILPSGGKTAYDVTYYAAIEMVLQKSYRLSIGGAGSVMRGINLALRQLDQVVDSVKGEKNLIPDYGFPEVYQGRRISTDNQAFTKSVVRDLELRNLLRARKPYSVKICASDYLDTHHTVFAYAPHSYMENTELDEETERLVGDVEELRLKAKQEKFSRRIDDLILLAWVARAAVLQWPMPE